MGTPATRVTGGATPSAPAAGSPARGKARFPVSILMSASADDECIEALDDHLLVRPIRPWVFLEPPRRVPVELFVDVLRSGRQPRDRVRVEEIVRLTVNGS